MTFPESYTSMGRQPFEIHIDWDGSSTHADTLQSVIKNVCAHEAASVFPLNYETISINGRASVHVVNMGSDQIIKPGDMLVSDRFWTCHAFVVLTDRGDVHFMHNWGTEPRYIAHFLNMVRETGAKPRKLIACARGKDGLSVIGNTVRQKMGETFPFELHWVQTRPPQTFRFWAYMPSSDPREFVWRVTTEQGGEVQTEPVRL